MRWRPCINLGHFSIPSSILRVEDTIKEELGYTDKELENLEVFTWDDLVAEYEGAVRIAIGSDLWDKLGYYINIEAMVRDDILSGYITEFEVEGQKLYLKER